MTTFKRQFISERYKPVDITILTYSGAVLLEQEGQRIQLTKGDLVDFVKEMNEVRKWSTSR